MHSGTRYKHILNFEDDEDTFNFRFPLLPTPTQISKYMYIQ